LPFPFGGAVAPPVPPVVGAGAGAGAVVGAGSGVVGLTGLVAWPVCDDDGACAPLVW
jgi:hypothetical protein